MVFSTKNSEEIKHGGKIIMPSSALEKLARLNISYPMLFKLTNKKRSTHCGVLEFVAEEGRIYIPHWVRTCACLSLPRSIPRASWNGDASSVLGPRLVSSKPGSPLQILSHSFGTESLDSRLHWCLCK